MRGFGSFVSAARVCAAHDDLRDHLRSRQHMNEIVSLAEQHRLFHERWGAVCAVLQATSQRSEPGNERLMRTRACVRSDS